MSNPYLAMGIDLSAMDHASFHGPHKKYPHNLANDWNPPPASSTTINFDGLDLNDEIFFNNDFGTTTDFNSAPTSASFMPASSGYHDASLLSSSLGTINYGVLQSNITTPDLPFALPLKYDSNTHYSHRRRFSLAVEQLNKMSLQHRMLSLSLPSPESLTIESSGFPPHELEKKTINPRQLFDADHLTSAQPNTRYVLPLLLSLPTLASAFKDNELNGFSLLQIQFSPLSENFQNESADPIAYSLSSTIGIHGDSLTGGNSSTSEEDKNLLVPGSSFAMNDECGKAILYWLNDTTNTSGDDGHDKVQNSGVSKRPSWKRHNLIQVLPPRLDAASQRSFGGSSGLVQKRKRRKSLTTGLNDNLSMASNIRFGFEGSKVGNLGSEGAFKNLAQVDTLGSNEVTLISGGLELGLSLGLFSPRANKKEEQDNYFKVLSNPDCLKPQRAQSQHSSQLEYTRPSVSDGHSPVAQANKKPDLAKAGTSRSISDSLNGGLDADDEPKPFPCPECDKQFKRLEHLKRHIRSVHLNIRPFHCKYCEKKFSRSDNLAQHLKTHFKMDANGATTIIYGNPNPHPRGGRKRGSSLVNEQQGAGHSGGND